MGAHIKTEEYFSGQGVAMIGLRNPVTGRPLGMRLVGNCPSLALKNATTVVEHKESTTGVRGIDKRLTTEIKVTMDATLEDFHSQNLADVLRGDASTIAAGTVTSGALNVFSGLITPLDHISVSSVVAKMGVANTITLYTDDATPWDYKANTDAGSLQFNDGASQLQANLGLVPTAVTIGATTSITMPSGHGFAVGDIAQLRGFTGADAATLNGTSPVVSAVDATHITVPIATTGLTITVAGGTRVVNKLGLMPGTVSYNYVDQQLVGAFTTGPKELFMRFEGLNTAEDNSPVVVEIFKYLLDPAQELALISDTIQSFVMVGTVLADPAQASGSKYYRVIKIDKAGN